MIKRRLLLLMPLLALGGCSAIHSTAERERSGRFSLQAIRGGQKETLTGRWRLRESSRFTELALMTPLYGILARITVSAAGATLERPNKTGDNNLETASTAEELMQRHLGFSLPVDMLSSWLSGLPWKERPVQQTQEGFSQSGWQVVIKRRKEDDTPALVSLTQPESPLQAGITVNLNIE